MPFRSIKSILLVSFGLSFLVLMGSGIGLGLLNLRNQSHLTTEGEILRLAEAASRHTRQKLSDLIQATENLGRNLSQLSIQDSDQPHFRTFLQERLTSLVSDPDLLATFVIWKPGILPAAAKMPSPSSDVRDWRQDIWYLDRDSDPASGVSGSGTQAAESLAAYRSLLARPFHETVLKPVVASSGKSSADRIAAISPMWRKGRFVGVVGNELSADAFTSLLQEAGCPAKNAECRIVSPGGTLIAVSEAPASKAPSATPFPADSGGLLHRSRDLLRLKLPIFLDAGSALWFAEVMMPLEGVDSVAWRVISRQAAWGLLLMAAFLLVLRYVIRRTLAPLEHLTRTAEDAALGDLKPVHPGSGAAELRRLGEAIQKMVAYLRKAAQVCQATAVGDLSKTVRVQSRYDMLGKSINQLVENLRQVVSQANRISNGDYTVEIRPDSSDDQLGNALAEMTLSMKRVVEESQRLNLLKSGHMELSEQMRGDQNISSLTDRILRFLCDYIHAQVGAFYLSDEEGVLRLVAGYALQKNIKPSMKFRPGDGLVGQAAIEKKPLLIDGLPDHYIQIETGLGLAAPRSILIQPLQYQQKIRGVIEFGTVHAFSDLHLAFIDQVSESIAIAIDTSQYITQKETLLKYTQQQAEELQAREEALKASNEELETQQKRIQQKNLELESARAMIEEKANDLELSSRYKSEFLATMSHELRTPLNSILLLSKLLAGNSSDNLSPRQVEFAQTIYSSGSDLLKLINEILDLSKIEAGKVEFNCSDVRLRDLAQNMHKGFKELAETKRLVFDVSVSQKLPDTLFTDQQRLEQVLRNFLSNAFKFTSKGKVTLTIAPANELPGARTGQTDLDDAVAFSVSDTGIGVRKDKHKIIFEAFQQADGTTSRKFGGTGLGLSISRELARLLGGYIVFDSQEGLGSTFTLILPQNGGLSPAVEPPCPTAPGRDATDSTDRTSEGIEATNPTADIDDLPEDDRIGLTSADRSILIIERDVEFAKTLQMVSRDKGFKTLICSDGATGLRLADCHHPTAIVLGVQFPEIDGYSVLSRLKSKPATRHIPVCLFSGGDTHLDAVKMGALGVVTRPVPAAKLAKIFDRLERLVDNPARRLLIVEDDPSLQKTLTDLLGGDSIEITLASSGAAARRNLKSEQFDCIVLDFDLRDTNGIEFLTRLRNDADLRVPVVVYTGKDLTQRELLLLDSYAERVVAKDDKSDERLLDVTTLFLHQAQSDLPRRKQKMLEMVQDHTSILRGKRILLVDDDMRNIYALSGILENRGMKVVVGKTGREALDRLDQTTHIDLVLIDMMMPEMDGYEAMRKIRKIYAYRKLPIIALTAKAMKGDRAKCIEAGASDYVSKPVDPEKLLSMLRVWLY